MFEVMLPVTARVDPLNVRFPESSKAPDVPAITTRLSVKSDTVAELRTVSPPEILAPPFASNAPPTVVIPVTFTAANVAPPDPPKTASDKVVKVTLRFVPPAPSSTINKSPSASVVVAVPPSISNELNGTVPAVSPLPDPVNAPLDNVTPADVVIPVTLRFSTTFTELMLTISPSDFHATDSISSPTVAPEARVIVFEFV